MTAFVLSCLGMLAVTAVLLARPLFKTAEPSLPRARRWLTWGVTLVAIAAISAGVYSMKTKWSWSGDNGATQANGTVDVDAMVAKLESRLKNNPNDVDGWLLLGRSYITVQRYALATNAYQQAYDLSQGQNIDATTGLAEALILTDETSLNGRAGQLIDQALQQQPNNPKALWYGGLAALKAEKLAVARDRFTALLALNPPDQIRGLLEREVQDLNQQLGGGTAAGGKAAAVVEDKNARKLIVNVKLADSLKPQLKEPVALFVLARDPKQGGAPLAVERHQSTELPLRVELTKADAMLPTRSIDNAEAVEVVARLSRSGAPLEQAGDYVGTAQYSFSKQGAQGTVTIEINRQVP